VKRASFLGAPLVVLIALAPRAAAADPTSAPATQAIEALQAEVDRDYAQALAADCAIACRALDSMRRAAERLCALDPGARCASAREKLEAASAHVRTACPGCPESLLDELPKTGAPGQGAAPTKKAETPTATEAPANAPPAPAEAPAAEQVATRKGGCAGCATSPAMPDGVAPAGLAWLGALAWMRRRRRRPQRPPRSIATYRD
jgi:MYXO-CTERM domain-containing protein